MGNYKEGSAWNDEMELRCLLIFKILEEERFPRKRQMELCRELSRNSELDATNLSAKVGNYKSAAGVNNASNASANTVSMYRLHGTKSSAQLRRLIAAGNY